jgi:hypothetical protein
MAETRTTGPMTEPSFLLASVHDESDEVGSSPAGGIAAVLNDGGGFGQR